MQVIEGMEIVKAIETCGSRGGDTAFDVMVANCGELPAGAVKAMQARSMGSVLGAAASAAGSRSMSTFASARPMQAARYVWMMACCQSGPWQCYDAYRLAN